MIKNNLPYKSILLNYRYIVFVILLILFNSTQIHAKTANNDSLRTVIKALKEKAIKYDKKNDVYNAIDYYNKYLNLKSKDIKLSYRLATLYFLTRNYAKADQYYDSVIHINHTKYPLAYYHKGIVCMTLKKYDKAIEAFTKFRKLYKDVDEKYNYRRLSAIYIESSDWAKNHSETDGEYNVTHPGDALNHATIDFAPYPVDDHTIIYGAVYSDSAKGINPTRQIFKAIKNNGQWKSVGLLDGEINSPEFNTGNAVLSADGKHMFFTRSKKNWQNIDVNEIYVSNLDSGKWQTPEILPYPVNDENYTTTQPALGKNQKTGNTILYFVSDRPGGKGGLDIWYSEYDKKTQTYKDPVDLDKGVNSVGDECCPFYDISSRMLYFSSNGRKNSLGGFDIYKSMGSTRKWIEAQPLPVPINSPYDDYYFTILKNNKEGFFSSNRPGSMGLKNGSCCDDIFSFQINECARVYSWGTIKSSVNYDLYHDLKEKYHLKLEYPESNTLLSDVAIELYLCGEKEGEEVLISKMNTNETGNYNFELERNKCYQVLVKNFGYFEKRLTVNTAGINCSDSINIGTTAIDYLPKVNVRVNIYYDHNIYKLSDSAKQAIDTTLMPLFDLFPNAIVEVGSHTDSTGSDVYNMKLSQRRSESVVDYLISKGIPSERLVAKGYGMSIPIAPNTNPDGSDNPAGRNLNRRTEIKIVGEISTVKTEE
jgi:OmpA-OmpF porin, OOP family